MSKENNLSVIFLKPNGGFCVNCPSNIFFLRRPLCFKNISGGCS